MNGSSREFGGGRSPLSRSWRADSKSRSISRSFHVGMRLRPENCLIRWRGRMKTGFSIVVSGKRCGSFKSMSTGIFVPAGAAAAAGFPSGDLVVFPPSHTTSSSHCPLPSRSVLGANMDFAISFGITTAASVRLASSSSSRSLVVPALTTGASFTKLDTLNDGFFVGVSPALAARGSDESGVLETFMGCTDAFCTAAAGLVMALLMLLDAMLFLVLFLPVRSPVVFRRLRCVCPKSWLTIDCSKTVRRWLSLGVSSQITSSSHPSWSSSTKSPSPGFIVSFLVASALLPDGDGVLPSGFNDE